MKIVKLKIQNYKDKKKSEFINKNQRIKEYNMNQDQLNQFK